MVDPLRNRRILVTRAARQAVGLAELLEAAGAEAICVPTVEFHRGDLSPILTALPTADWLVFSSANGVEFLADACTVPPTVRVAVVGAATAEAATRRGLKPEIMPKTFDAEHLADVIPDVAGRVVLLPQADGARPILAERLRERGGHVVTAVAYHTKPVTTGRIPALLDALTFTSPSTVSGFLAMGGYQNSAAVACIGPVTAAAAQQAGLRVDVIADPRTAAGLVEGLIRHFA